MILILEGMILSLSSYSTAVNFRGHDRQSNAARLVVFDIQHVAKAQQGSTSQLTQMLKPVNISRKSMLTVALLVMLALKFILRIK